MPTEVLHAPATDNTTSAREAEIFRGMFEIEMHRFELQESAFLLSAAKQVNFIVWQSCLDYMRASMHTLKCTDIRVHLSGPTINRFPAQAL